MGSLRGGFAARLRRGPRFARPRLAARRLRRPSSQGPALRSPSAHCAAASPPVFAGARASLAFGSLRGGFAALPKCRRRTVSRVLFRRAVAPAAARIIRLGGALLRRSSAQTRTLAPLGASGGPPSTAALFELAPGGACPAAGHPAVARGLLPHDFTLA